MLYVGIDQHLKQLTINCRDERGETVLHRQVSTKPEQVASFFSGLGEFVAIVEICGFGDWLVEALPNWGCRQVILCQPTQRDRRKTDRRDASALSEILWISRDRIQEGRRPKGVRQVALPSKEDAECRQLTAMRRSLAKERTRCINQLHRLIARHNLQHEQPTKGFKTKAVRQWIEQLELPRIDGLLRDQLLARWSLLDSQLKAVDQEIQAYQHPAAGCLATIPGISAYGSLAIASRLGPGIHAFANGDALANFWGLTPSCANSGESNQRLGGITKQGSSLVRSVLGNCVVQLLRKDAWLRSWYQRIKRRRGGKIAMVAVMRRIATIIWRLIKYNHPYVCGGPEKVKRAHDLLAQFGS